MPIHPTPTITPSEPGGALRLDVNATGGVTAGTDGVRATALYGAEAKMTALNVNGTASVVAFGGGGSAPVVIPFARADVDYSEFSSLPQADPGAGVFTGQVEGVYEIGCQVSFTLTNVASAHVELSIWTDCGATSIPVGNLAEGQPYGTRWQRIDQRLIGYQAASAATVPTDQRLPFHVSTVSTVVCLKQPNGSTFVSSLPAPCRFLFGIQTDAVQIAARVRAPAANQTYAWMRWLGEPTP